MYWITRCPLCRDKTEGLVERDEAGFYMICEWCGKDIAIPDAELVLMEVSV